MSNDHNNTNDAPWVGLTEKRGSGLAVPHFTTTPGLNGEVFGQRNNGVSVVY